MKNNQGWHKREDHKEEHAVFPENQFAGHNYPEIQRGFVGIINAMVCKSEYRTCSQRFIGNTQITQLVSNRI